MTKKTTEETRDAPAPPIAAETLFDYLSNARAAEAKAREAASGSLDLHADPPAADSMSEFEALQRAHIGGTADGAAAPDAEVGALEALAEAVEDAIERSGTGAPAATDDTHDETADDVADGDASERETAGNRAAAADAGPGPGRAESNHMSYAHEPLPPIKVVGVGGGGSNAINRMISARLPGVQYVAVNTDLQALEQCDAEIKVRIGDRLTKGLGAGSDPLRGQRAAEESREAIEEALRDGEMVFVTACLGGGTGTGAAPIIAEVAREQGALTIGVVTKPFAFEGAQRRQKADEGVRDLQEKVDTLIVIPNDRLLHVCDQNVSIREAFELADDVLRQGIQGISELITVPGMVNLDFADVRKVMTDAGPALMAIGTGRGENRAVEAAREAIASPLLEVDITGATGVLFNVTAPANFGLHELDSAARAIAEVVDPEAEIIFGAAIDESLNDEVRITVIATGFSGKPALSLGQAIEQAMEEPPPIKLADIQTDPALDQLTEADLPTFLRRTFPSR